MIISSNSNFQAFSLPDKLGTVAPQKIKYALFLICKNTQKAAITDTKTPKSGRIYFYNKNGRRIRHIASAPSESHANLTGALNKEMNFKVTSPKEALFGYSNNSKYGKFLELGTSKMSPRPTLKNAMEKEMQKNRAILTNELNPNKIS